MATRPVFAPGKRKNEVDVFMTEFVWNSGLSVSQKRKNIMALHEAYVRRFPERKVLEISSKSENPLGVALSAFHLKKYVPSLGKSIPVECVFQGGKVFAAGGPYSDLYEVSPRDAKRDPRLRESGTLRSYCFEGDTFPIVPKTAFYDWIYVTALMENPNLAAELVQYDSFTDIEFNPDKSVNCQAGAAAMYVALFRKDVLEQCGRFDAFMKLIEK